MKYEIIVERTETFIFASREYSSEEDARQAVYEEIREGNVDPYFADWNFEITEK